jgi:fucose 4-O-acetylase-like acetyltransferase
MEKYQNRIAYVDVAKALTISLIVYLHTIDKFSLSSIFPTIFLDYTFYWMMPLFAILSGLFFSIDKNWETFLRKKCRQLVLPLFSWSFLALLLEWLLYDVYMSISRCQFPHLGSYVEFMWGMLSDRGWWFLRSLFFCFLYAYVSLRLFRERYLSGLFFSICLLYFFFIFRDYP